jgi:hypothetical protein
MVTKLMAAHVWLLVVLVATCVVSSARASRLQGTVAFTAPVQYVAKFCFGSSSSSMRSSSNGHHHVQGKVEGRARKQHGRASDDELLFLVGVIQPETQTPTIGTSASLCQVLRHRSRVDNHTQHTHASNNGSISVALPTHAHVTFSYTIEAPAAQCWLFAFVSCPDPQQAPTSRRTPLLAHEQQQQHHIFKSKNLHHHLTLWRRPRHVGVALHPTASPAPSTATTDSVNFVELDMHVYNPNLDPTAAEFSFEQATLLPLTRAFLLCYAVLVCFQLYQIHVALQCRGHGDAIVTVSKSLALVFCLKLSALWVAVVDLVEYSHSGLEVLDISPGNNADHLSPRRVLQALLDDSSCLASVAVLLLLADGWVLLVKRRVSPSQALGCMRGRCCGADVSSPLSILAWVMFWTHVVASMLVALRGYPEHNDAVAWLLGLVLCITESALVLFGCAMVLSTLERAHLIDLNNSATKWLSRGGEVVSSSHMLRVSTLTLVATALVLIFFIGPASMQMALNLHSWVERRRVIAFVSLLVPFIASVLVAHAMRPKRLTQLIMHDSSTALLGDASPSGGGGGDTGGGGRNGNLLVLESWHEYTSGRGRGARTRSEEKCRDGDIQQNVVQVQAESEALLLYAQPRGQARADSTRSSRRGLSRLANCRLDWADEAEQPLLVEL